MAIGATRVAGEGIRVAGEGIRVAGEGIRVAGEGVRVAGRTAGLLLAADDLRASGWSSDRSRPGPLAATQTVASIGKMPRAIAPKTAARSKATLGRWKLEAFVALSPVLPVLKGSRRSLELEMNQYRAKSRFFARPSLGFSKQVVSCQGVKA